MKPKVYFPFSAKARQDFWHPDTLERLGVSCELIAAPAEAADPWSHIPPDARAIVTGWGVDRKLPAAAWRRVRDLEAMAVFGGSPVVIEDAAEAANEGIAVISASQAIATGVAEMTIGLMLASLYDLASSASAYHRTGKITVNPLHRSGSVAGAAIGMVGFGFVGRQVASRLSAFSPRLMIYDPYVSPDQAAACGAATGSLEDVLASSEILTIHAAWTPQTHGMIDRARIGLIRPGTLVVSTARMPLFDEEALAERVREGTIRLATDFVPFRPDVWGRSEVHERDNLIGVPGHTSITRRGVRAMGDLVADELERLFAGKQLANSVSVDWIRHTTNLVPTSH